MDENNISHYMLMAIRGGTLPHDHQHLYDALMIANEDGRMSAVDRRNMNGHFVSSAVVLNHSHTRVLMINHLFLQRVLFPGGHIDADEDAMIAAFREVFEETGISARPLAVHPIDIDTHMIPANPSKNEGEHLHVDLLFLGEANSMQHTTMAEEEVSLVRWQPLDHLLTMDERFVNVHEKIMQWKAAHGG